MAENTVGRWGVGPNYGPVLSQTDLYLLGTKLELHPILECKHPKFHLVFNLQTGQTGGYNPNDRERDLPFSQKDEPATLPRVAQLIIICERTPWCTIVKNESGVTLNDVCQKIWKDYTDNNITEAELQSLPARLQEQIRRFAASQAHSQQTSWGAGGYYPSPPVPGRFRRIDWVRERMYFEELAKDDELSQKRLGFKAPNVFVMMLSA